MKILHKKLMRRKKIFFILTCIFIGAFFFIKYNIENNTAFFYKYKNIIPSSVKWQMRVMLTKINSLYVFKKDVYIFKKNEIIKLKSDNFDNKLVLFNNANLIFTGPRAYFASDSENLFLITGTGILMYANIKELTTNNESLIFKKIKTNIDDFLFEYKKNKKNLHFHTSTIKSILIKDKKIYISIIQKFNQKTNIIKPSGCYKHSILVGDLNFKKLRLQNFFKINKCRPVYHDYVGGTLSDFKDGKILYTVGDFAVCEHPAFISRLKKEYCKNNNSQVLKSALGKIFEINLDDASANIISLGHDNPQGLYYDKIHDVIFSTEHGPQGGDEININISPSKDNVKNYGYPISSYGEHYGYTGGVKNYKYELAPLYKSHKKYGFIEPLDYFVPSIGISPINKFNNKLFVGALGSDIDEGDLSLHVYDINNKFELENHHIFKIYQRIRDIHVEDKYNKLFVFLETNGSIAIMDLKN